MDKCDLLSLENKKVNFIFVIRGCKSKIYFSFSEMDENLGFLLLFFSHERWN